MRNALPTQQLQARYANRHRATLKGGIGGAIAGLAVGLVGVYGARLRYPAFRSLTLPLQAFLVTSAGTFAGKEVFVSLQRKCVGWVGWIMGDLKGHASMMAGNLDISKSATQSVGAETRDWKPDDRDKHPNLLT